jgi:hypothetical protein
MLVPGNPSCTVGDRDHAMTGAAKTGARFHIRGWDYFFVRHPVLRVC